MHYIDFTLITLYLIAVFLVGLYFYRKNKDREDYYVGGRSISAWHVGLSVVATDVGGGFSIGLGALGFTMGLSGTWLLFTGLIGAWLAAVFIIPKLKKLDKKFGMLTYPDLLRHKLGGKVAIVAALISGIGYMGFTGGQVLAGAELSSATIFANIPIDIDPMTFSIIVIAVIMLLYTSLGGLKAVIYTDTIQWIILLSGLIFLAIPLSINHIGGLSAMADALPEGYLRLDNLTATTFINWMVTIIPIWLIAMTLYQRMYATKNEKEAKKAWFIAGFFEYPIMAFTGVFLGMAARVMFPEEPDPDEGLPRILKEVLPIGAKGVVIAAYFSAIMSTADSCLIASSGNFINDILERIMGREIPKKKMMWITQGGTLFIGLTALTIAMLSESVLDTIIQAYAFMAAGLFIPTLAVYFMKRPKPIAAMISMISGGTLALILIFAPWKPPLGLDPSFWGILLSAVTFLIVTLLAKPHEEQTKLE